MAQCPGFSVMSWIWNYVWVKQFFPHHVSQKLWKANAQAYGLLSMITNVWYIYFSKFLETALPHG